MLWTCSLKYSLYFSSIALRNERSVAGVTTMDNVLYFAGGFDGVKHCKDACMYDPRENKWTAIADMNVPRYF